MVWKVVSLLDSSSSTQCQYQLHKSSLVKTLALDRTGVVVQWGSREQALIGREGCHGDDLVCCNLIGRETGSRAMTSLPVKGGVWLARFYEISRDLARSRKIWRENPRWRRDLARFGGNLGYDVSSRKIWRERTRSHTIVRGGNPR